MSADDLLELLEAWRRRDLGLYLRNRATADEGNNTADWHDGSGPGWRVRRIALTAFHASGTAADSGASLEAGDLVQTLRFQTARGGRLALRSLRVLR